MRSVAGFAFFLMHPKVRDLLACMQLFAQALAYFCKSSLLLAA
jgi:hypothetical protein